MDNAEKLKRGGIAFSIAYCILGIVGLPYWLILIWGELFMNRQIDWWIATIIWVVACLALSLVAAVAEMKAAEETT